METKIPNAIIYDASADKTIFEGEPIEGAFSFDDDTNEVEEETTEQNESVEVAENEEEETDDTTESEEITEEIKKDDTKLTPQEEFFWARLEEMASEDEFLATAMKKTDKSIRECFDYMKMLAKKKVAEQRGAQCVAVEGTEMLGWAKHYYIESKETIDAEMKPKTAKKEKTAEEKKREETTKKVYENPLLASLMKKGAKVSTDGEVAVTKTTTKKDENGNVVSSKTTKTDAEGTRTTTIVKDGKEYTMTEFALF